MRARVGDLVITKVQAEGLENCPAGVVIKKERGKVWVAWSDGFVGWMPPHAVEVLSASR
tara:strand:+ start:2251 stop:2427 length:177 start_codon:yes stop_codon:yes gene_type:complete